MNRHTNNYTDEVREVPLRDVFLVVQDYLKIITHRWWIILIVAGLFAGWFGYAASTEQVVYDAPLTFVINEDSPSAGGVGSILGQFGLGGVSEGYNLQKVLALAQSQKIMNDLLLDTMIVDGVANRTGNHIVQVYDLVEEWELDTATSITGDSISVLTLAERKLLKQLYHFVLNKPDGLLSFSAEEGTGVLTVMAETLNEDLSLNLARQSYQRLSDFYTLESIGGSQASVERLQFKADSLKQALDRADYALANAYDRNQGVVRRTNLVRQAQLNREVSMLSLAYGEVIQNLEKASFLLNTRTPFFQVIDAPFQPLSTSKPKLIVEVLIGAILGGFLAFFVFALRKFYGDVMHPDPQPTSTDEY